MVITHPFITLNILNRFQIIIVLGLGKEIFFLLSVINGVRFEVLVGIEYILV